MKARYALGFAAMLAFLLPGMLWAAPSGMGSQALYKQNCAMCHGPDGKANTPIGKKLKVANLLSPAVQNQSDAQLVEVIQNGKGNMPANRTLTPEQVKGLVAYIRELAKSGPGAQK